MRASRLRPGRCDRVRTRLAGRPPPGRRLQRVPLLELVPRSFGDYEAAGGGRGLQAALGAWPLAVIGEVARSGLRGRGGAGFPTAVKWRAVRGVGAGPRFAVCNAAEGEPATFKDRLLLRTNPYQVLEGLAIAAHAVGAERAYVGLKEAFTPEVQALSRALGEMGDADALGGVPVEIVLGPDLYLFGEETGMEEVIEGRPPLPRVARPFIQGLFARPPEDNPTLVNNVETLANVPHILADGADWLRANGTEAAPGTMVFTVCGDVRREGVFELPLGLPLRYLVEELGGGSPAGRSVKAVFPGRLQHRRRSGAAGCADGLRLDAAGGIRPRSGRVRRVRRLGLHGPGGLPLLAVPVRGVVRSVPCLQVRHRRGHRDPAGDPGGRRIRPGLGAHLGAGEELDRWPEVRPTHRGEPAHAEPGPGVRRGVPQPPREVVSAAPPAPVPHDRRLGRHRGTVCLRPDLRPEATRLGLAARSRRFTPTSPTEDAI